jgi:hypothetical protein
MKRKPQACQDTIKKQHFQIQELTTKTQDLEEDLATEHEQTNLITGLANRVETLSQCLSGMYGFEDGEELKQTPPESDLYMI